MKQRTTDENKNKKKQGRPSPGDGEKTLETDGPTCPVDHQCGACQRLSVPYAEQLARKDARVAELFRAVKTDSRTDRPNDGRERAVWRAGGRAGEPDGNIEAGGAEAGGADGRPALLPIIGMDDPFRYRNKVVSPYAPGRKLPARGGRDAGRHNVRGEGGRTARIAAASSHEILCGMYATGSHRIIATDGCLIENEDAKRIILTVRDLMPKFGITPYREDAGTGFLRHAVVRVGHASGEILVTLVTNGRQFPASRAFCRELVRRCPLVTTVVQNVNTRKTNVILGEEEHTLYGPGFILDQLCGLSFRISSHSFYQVNAVQTEVLYRQAVEMAGFTGAEHVIDAYCGTGTIGLVAAKSGAAHVIGVDSTASAIHDARENARHNGVDNASFVVADAGEFMREMVSEGERAEVVFMDPPRSGASEEFLDALAEMAPQRIVYISCNPETQARDIRYLETRGFSVRTVQPVDMFPHTDHIESIALIVL